MNRLTLFALFLLALVNSAASANQSDRSSGRNPSKLAIGSDTSIGKSLIGKVNGNPKVTGVYNRFLNGENGTKPGYYGLSLSLMDTRDKSIYCNQFFLDDFRESSSISGFRDDLDKINKLMGQEVILENVRKSSVSKSCVFSSIRLNDNPAGTANNNAKDIGTGMPLSGDRLVDKVSVMGLRLCGRPAQAGTYLENQGYQYPASLAAQGRSFSANKIDGIDNYDLKVNYDTFGTIRPRPTMHLISFQGSFKHGPNLFNREKSRFEQETGIRLGCKQIHVGTNDDREECKYPDGETDRDQPGFSFSITRHLGVNALYIDASAWGYDNCGAPVNVPGADLRSTEAANEQEEIAAVIKKLEITVHAIFPSRLEACLQRFSGRTLMPCDQLNGEKNTSPSVVFSISLDEDVSSVPNNAFQSRNSRITGYWKLNHIPGDIDYVHSLKDKRVTLHNVTVPSSPRSREVLFERAVVSE